MVEKAEQTQRLQYHIVPPKGLLNDPNGLSFFRGRHHVFYQWNPHGTEHKLKSWGHVSTADFLHWESHPPALEPSDWYDKDGCYSGSAVVYENKLYLFYTGNVRNAAGERESYQCVAVSEDGIRFEKLGPVLEQPEGYTAHIRDPKVWKEEDGMWKMILGAQSLEEKGTALLYQSANLLKWEMVSDLGRTLPEMGFMWECPDLVRMQDEDLFLFCPQGIELDANPHENLYQSGYLLGRLFDEEGVFQTNGMPFRKVDQGFEFYAPQTYRDVDGRIILFGWLGLMKPQDEKNFPSVKDGYIHCLTVPRLVEVTEGALIQTPLPELERLHKGEPLIFENQQTFQQQLPAFQNELRLRWEEPTSFCLQVRNEVKISYDNRKQQAVIERTSWSSGKREKRFVLLDQPLRDLTIYMESSSLELFFNSGRATASLRYVAEETETGLSYQQEKAGENLFCFYQLGSYQGILLEDQAGHH